MKVELLRQLLAPLDGELDVAIEDDYHDLLDVGSVQFDDEFGVITFRPVQGDIDKDEDEDNEDDDEEDTCPIVGDVCNLPEHVKDPEIEDL